MQDATDVEHHENKSNQSQATNGAEPVFAAAKFTLTAKGRKRRDLPTPPTSDPEEDDSPKDPSNVRHSKRLANKHLDFSVFKFGNPLSHLQGEERKLLKQLAMEQEEDDEDVHHEEVKKRPRGRPPVHAKKIDASPKPIVTHAKPQARPSLVLKIGNSSDGSAGSSTTTSPGTSPPSTPPIMPQSTTSSPQSNANSPPPPSSISSATEVPLSSTATNTSPNTATSTSTNASSTPPATNGHPPPQSRTYFLHHELLLPKPEPPSSPTNNSETSKSTPELNATPSHEESELDEYGAPQIEESSTPFEAEVKAENPLSNDAIRAHHSLENPSTTDSNAKAPERVKRKYTKRGTSKVALAKAAAQKAKAAEAIATAFSINFSQALPYPHNYTPYNPVLAPHPTLIPSPALVPISSPAPSSTSGASPPVSSPPSEQSNPIDLLAIKTEALKMLQQCVANRLITEEQYKAKQREFLISISF